MESREALKEKGWEALYQETKKRLDELTILYEMTKISISSIHLDQMLTEMVKTLRGFFRCEAFGIFLMDERSKTLTLHPSSVGLSVQDRQGPVGRAAETGESLWVDDVGKDPGFSGKDGRMPSEMCVPLKVGGKMIGVIDAQSQASGAFSTEALRLLEKTGDHLAAIIENARSEERYRTVVENALDGVLVMGEDHRLIYVNEKLVGLLGSSKDELTGMDFRECLDEESRRVMANREALRLRGEETSPRYELKVLGKDGGIKHVEVSSTEIRDPHGNANIVAFLKDISQKRRMEEQLLQTEKLRALGEMASGIAHDFNNALAIILGNTQLLIYDAQDQESKETLKTIEKVARDSAHRVRRLLEFTRKGNRKGLFNIDLNAVVRDAVEATKPKWKDEVQGKGIQMEMVLSLEEILPVGGIATELREVITNMICNAVEAMPDGGRIEIRTFQKGGKVCVQVSDTGTGMTEEAKSKIFEPFFTTKPFSNSGLGLSMSYGIIKGIGGEIEVESKAGHGTTFSILLPVKLDGKGIQVMESGGVDSASLAIHDRRRDTLSM